MDAGQWEKARELYHRAGELVPAPTLTLREARALTKLGKLVEASELLVRAARWPLDSSAPPAFRAATQEAAAELEKLRSRIPTLKLSVENNQPAAIKLDGVAVPPALVNVDRPLDPGPHLIEGTVSGTAILPQRVRLAEAEHLEIVLQRPTGTTAAPAPADSSASSAANRDAGRPPSENTVAVNDTKPAAPLTGGNETLRTAGWIALGVGAVGIGVGVVTGIVATSKHSDLDSECPDHRCSPAVQSDLDSFHAFRTASTAGYIVGVIALVGGAVLLLTSSKSAPTRPTAFVGPGSAGVQGAF
jgi:hypothetical protein